MKAGYSPFPRWAPYFFLAPFVLLFSTFTLWPLLKSLGLAFQQTFGPEISTFIGWRNFAFLLGDPLFWRALGNTLTYTGGSVFILLPLSLALAMLLNRPDVRGRAFWRLIFFAPSLVGVVFVAVIFALAFEKRTGLVNLGLHKLIGFDLDFPWLQNYVMAALILASLWMSVGFNMIYFLAALQNVSQETVEAAKVDGASAWQTFRNVTLPAILPVAGFVTLLSTVHSLQLFELPFVLLNGSAGPKQQGLTIVMYLYQTGFETGDLGYASAIGWVLALILVSFTLLQRRLTARHESL